MKKKLLFIMIALFILIPNNAKQLHAEDFSDTAYWDEYCSVSENSKSEVCEEYKTYKLNQSGNRIDELQKEMDAVKGELDKAVELANTYAIEAAALEAEIQALQAEIDQLIEQIKILEENIEKNEILVDELNQRVLKRMRDSQTKMHFNSYLDFILGSTSFEDLLRRSYGVKAITEKDGEDREKLIEIINQLEIDKKKADDSKAELDTKQASLLADQAYYNKLMEYYNQIANEYEAQLEDIRNDLESERKNYSNIANDIGDLSGIPSSSGLISPAPGSRITAGTWYYPASFGGGIHLGVDYGLKRGGNLYAPANGVVILSADGCGEGYLGSGCGSAQGGVYAGGNQIIMIVSADNRVYGVSFFHLLKGTPIGTGYVSQGDYIGQVGSSGNSTGPHCHIELYYLGEGDMSDIQNDYLYRNYSLSFNCGWGSYAFNRLCESGVGAPCRLRPELYFGS